MHMLDDISSIAVAGSIAYDDIMVFPGKFEDHFHPERLHQINISFAVSTLKKHIGGTATNIAYATRLITKKQIKLVGVMGKDHAQLSHFFEKNHIDTASSIIDSELYTSTGKVITDMSDNQIWGYYYGAAEKGDLLDLKPFDHRSFFILSANHAKAFLHIQNHCITNNIRYLYDPGMSLTWISDEDLRDGILHAQMVAGNDYEINQIFRRLDMTAADLQKKKITLIMTLGADGVHILEKNESYQIPAMKIKKIVDPTGAGDAWRGGFIGALYEGKSIKEAAKIGNVLASFAIEVNGTVEYKPSVTEIENRLAHLSNQI